MRKNQLSIHSENILPIIKKWLYTDRDIFVRELVSNATDAITKLQVLSSQAKPPQISVRIDKEKKALIFSDTGLGMTEEEVEKYIAQIAFSGAEEFVEKYKSQTSSDSMIGHFGLGFYSSYMVAERVEIDTLSYLPDAKPVFWECDGSSTYSIATGKRTEVGTTITLFLSPESLEYLEEKKVRELLKKYCSFMPFPLSLNDSAIPICAPLWMKAPSSCTEKEYLDLHEKLYPLDSPPLFWVHLNVDYPFRLKGILYFPKIHRHFDYQKTSINLYCNRVFVSESCKEILPDYLTVLHGVLDSPDIPLNVSRSTLQVDPNVKQLSTHIAKKIADRLMAVYTQDKAKYIESWPDVETIVKLGILQDDKFYEKTKDLLLWKTGPDTWTTIGEYLERAKEKKVFYAPADRISAVLKLYTEKKREILLTSSPLDTAVIQFLETKLSIPFQRIDGALDADLLDPSREKGLLDADGKSEAGRLADFVRSALDQKDLVVEAKSLASDTLPALFVLDEQERRMRDYLALSEAKPRFASIGKKTFIVNTNHPLIQSLEKLKARSPEAAQEMAKGIYGLSLLAQRELEPQGLEEVIHQQQIILEKLTKLAIHK